MSDFETIAEIWRNNNFAKEKHPNKHIRRPQVFQFLSEQTASQTFKEKINSKPKGHIVAKLVNELWQMDIFDLSRYEKHNDGFRYRLACADVFSRQAYVKPMKTRTRRPSSLLSHTGSFIKNWTKSQKHHSRSGFCLDQ